MSPAAIATLALVLACGADPALALHINTPRQREPTPPASSASQQSREGAGIAAAAGVEARGAARVDDAAMPVAATSQPACTDAGRLRDAVNTVLRISVANNAIGHFDAVELAPMLARSFHRHVVITDPSTLILDIGAHLGATSEAFMALFSALPCERHVAHAINGSVALLANGSTADIARVRSSAEAVLRSEYDCGRVKSVRVIAFEPLAASYAALVARAEASGWMTAGWTGFRAAIAEANADAVSIFTAGNYGDQHASLSSEASYHQDAATRQQMAENGFDHPDMLPRRVETVPAFTVAEVARQLGAATVFLLKIDVEGYDAPVLRGAEPMLRRGAVRWIVFEYNNEWRAAGNNTLHDITRWLATVGYSCYLLMPDLMLPLSGEYWQPIHEHFSWSNVMCGLTASPETRALVLAYNAPAAVLDPTAIAEIAGADEMVLSIATLAQAPLHLPACAAAGEGV